MNEDRERSRTALVIAAVAVCMTIVGALLVGLGSALALLGGALLVFGVLGVIQAMLIGLGLLPVPGERDDRDPR